MLKDLTLSRDHFADDPFLVGLLDEIAQLSYIAKEVRKQGETFRNAKLTNDEIRGDVKAVRLALKRTVLKLTPLLFLSRRDTDEKTAALKDVYRENGMHLEVASGCIGRISEIEKRHYEGSGATGNAFRTLQYRLDLIRQRWSGQ